MPDNHAAPFVPLAQQLPRERLFVRFRAGAFRQNKRARPAFGGQDAPRVFAAVDFALDVYHVSRFHNPAEASPRLCVCVPVGAGGIIGRCAHGMEPMR